MLGVFFFCFFVFLSNWKHNSKLQWFTIVTLIFITIAAVWKHGFRSLVCKCLFPYNPRWSGTHIRYLTCETHVTLADDLAALAHYSCLVTLKPRNISDLLGLGLNILCWPMRILILQGGKKKKKVRQWKCVILCVNVVINFNTSLYKKWKEDWLLGVSGKKQQQQKTITSTWLWLLFCLYTNQGQSKIS